MALRLRRSIMGWIGMARNLCKAAVGAVEGKPVKSLKSLGFATGHAVTGVVGIVIGEEIKEGVDEALNQAEETTDEITDG